MTAGGPFASGRRPFAARSPPAARRLLRLRPMATPLPVAHNRFQRWYFRWAAPHYARMAPEVRAQAEAIDRLLYSRRGLWVWLGLALGVAGAAAGLAAAGVAFASALLVSLALAFCFVVGGVSVWLMPQRYSGRRLWRIALIMMLGTYAGVFASVIGTTWRSAMSGEQWLQTLGSVLWRATPFQLLAGLALMLVMWGTAAARRYALQQELAQSRLEQERDAAARQAAEARLKLLQVQIQPHFLFNTLTTLQHWVDTQDARGGPLLKSLTSFLRQSVGLLEKDSATLAQEAELARTYLGIMQARLGPRLRHEIALPAEVADTVLPPGLLLTLVENAIEHGIEPALHGGLLRIEASRGDGGVELSVRNGGVPLAVPVTEGVGLRNSRERLIGRHGAQARLELLRDPLGETLARVWLPDAVIAAERAEGAPAPGTASDDSRHPLCH